MEVEKAAAANGLTAPPTTNHCHRRDGHRRHPAHGRLPHRPQAQQQPHLQVPEFVLFASFNANRTPTLFQYNFKTIFTSDPTLIMTSFLLSMLPMHIAYLFVQRYTIGSLVPGGVKA